MFPEKLKKGDEVRVVAPSRSLGAVTKDNIDHAIKVLESLGLKVTFGKHVNEKDSFSSSSIQSRLEDLYEAFQDKSVKAILAVIGGSNANQLIQNLDYSLIKNNPKIFCGFSDITALQNAIFHKTGLVTYSGPQFSSFAMKKGFEYTLEYFKRICFENSSKVNVGKNPIQIYPSKQWSDDAWYRDQENRTFYDNNEGYWLIQPGQAKGRIIGGNLSTFQLLHGTSFIPSFENTILFLESESLIVEGERIVEFDRDLQSVIHQPEFDKVKALVFGRFEKKFGMNIETLKLIISKKSELKNLPIIANVDFGHTMPMITFPIGGNCEINATFSNINITVEAN
ncbi:MAG TPA: S66 peptidase family protein [Gammaproteobacteria bacterium]|nr:S66 peptidase family protein [Gammaproteobacteria bacterium]